MTTAPTPGEILSEEFLQPLGIDPSELDLPSDLADLRIDAELARQLADRLGTSEAFWLNLQANHDGSSPLRLWDVTDDLWSETESDAFRAAAREEAEAERDPSILAMAERAIAQARARYLRHGSHRGFSYIRYFDVADGIWVGRVADIRGIVTFHADTKPELEAAFREAVDDYCDLLLGHPDHDVEITEDRPATASDPAVRWLRVLRGKRTLQRLRLEAEDVATYDAAQARLAAGDDEMLPRDVVRRLLNGEPPLRVLRQFRQLTVAELAERADVARAAIEDAEAGRTELPPSSLAALANALGVDEEDLM